MYIYQYIVLLECGMIISWLWQIRDGNSEASNFVGRYCGTSIPPPITSSGNALWLKFKSDSYTTGTGFRARWNVCEYSSLHFTFDC